MRNKHLKFFKFSLWCLCLLMLALADPAMGTDILTPTGYGNVTSSYFAGRAFDDQPTWSGSAPSGGGSGINAFMVTWESSKVSYIDLGTDWADWRIEETWTKYIQYRSSNGHAFAEVWWDDDIDATNDGTTETTLNFASQAHDGSGLWIQDVDTSASPVTPQGRYLLLRQPATIDANDASEMAIVGYVASNTAPTVDAGSDDLVALADGASLDGTVTDDGEPDPPGAFTALWTKQSGPGTVTFDDDEAIDTDASFSVSGVYVLRLTADDGDLSDYDEVTITVNAPPSVDAGSNDSITLPDDDVSLDGTVSDDGIPASPGSVSVTWTKQSGPGTVTFDDDNAVDTDATFSAAGTYVLRLTGDDGDLTAYDEVTITVNAAATSDILTPYSYGGVTSSYFANRAFNAQPTWTGSAPTGGDTSYDAFTVTWEGANKISYIDFGSNWASWRIQETWTKYILSRSGTGAAFVELWWDDDIDSTNDGAAENTLNFNTQSHDGSGAWIQDVDTSSNVVVPQARYLLLKAPASPGNEPNEIAIVGYIAGGGSNMAPSVDAGSGQMIMLPDDDVDLDGTVTDDGLPNPPASVTVTWTKLSGPGTVTFGNANAVDTTAEFSTDGVYVLRLTADDGDLAGYDDVAITVSPALPTLSMDEVLAFDYQSLTLVDEVDCGDAQDSHTVIESSTGVSQIQSIMGRNCRVLLNPSGAEPRYFAYRLGEDDLEAGQAYILVVEYPEDQPRTIIVMNRGCETTRTFHTGTTVGDALNPTYEHSKANSMQFGLSYDYRTAEQLFHLHDRYPGIYNPRNTEYPRDDFPDDGMLVIIGQYAYEDCPMNAGAAVARIALYEAPSLNTYTQELNIPSGLPKRHLFWREEMSDGCVNYTPAGVTDDIDWYEYKARLCKFLGMNTFTKDLMEFGHAQGWDRSKYANWYNGTAYDNRWEMMLYRMTAGNYGLDFLPYYEYAGGTQGLGLEKRAEPLNGNDDYINIPWCENFNVDCTDPDTYTDITRVIECTMEDIMDGDRPAPLDPAKTWVYNSTAGKWGYIDFGADWDDIRITQTWTRSTQFRGGSATPYQALYWHTSPTGFSGSTVPQGAVQETTLNFITQTQNNLWAVWSRDVNLSQQNAITPSARYLCIRAANTITESQEGLIVGWIEDGGDPEIQTIPVTAGSIDGHNLGNFFDNQGPFNTGTFEFAGMWLRARPSHIPIGFGDDTRERFADDCNGGTPVTRAMLEADPYLLEDYYDWWMDKRKDFLDYVSGYLQTNVNSDAVVLYTTDASEAGTGIQNHPQVIAEDYDAWAGLATSRMSYEDAMNDQVHLDALLRIAGISATEEWKHSTPWADVDNYSSNEGVMLTHTFNQPYTVSDPDTWDAFQTGSGLAAIRHYCLNEQSFLWNDSSNVGYFVSDASYAGPYTMIGEARAIAYGDPYYIGYLASNGFNRWFPGYVRDFNANYLALPAMTSTVVTNAATDSEVIVRRINTPSDGTWLAIVNTSIEEKEDVVITLPVSGTTTDAVTGDPITMTNGTITLDMWPARLKAIHIDD